MHRASYVDLAHRYVPCPHHDLPHDHAPLRPGEEGLAVLYYVPGMEKFNFAYMPCFTQKIILKQQ